MKKIFNFCLALAVATAWTSCSNELPEFDDAEAFAAFTKTELTVDENVEGGELQIPVMLTSLAGIETTVQFEIVDSTAVEGKHFTVLNATNTLTFTKEEPTQNITIQVVDNEEYTGDVVFKVNLYNPAGVKLGASKVCKVKISDDEHPLAFMLGEYTASGTSYFNNGSSWDMSIAKDDEDPTIVWISNIASTACPRAVYGKVSADKTEIQIPVDQITGVSSSYDVKLEGFYGTDGDENIPTGGYISGTIDENGNITILDWYGVQAFNKGTTTSAGWYDLMTAPVTWTKK